jgi:DNA-binding NarL/FixJ family response regulator
VKKTVIRVLVVEDFEPFQEFICSALEKKPQLQVICKAQDGSEAVQQARKLQPDLIVIDVGLPKVHGIEAIRQIREYVPKSIVLFVSQNSDADVVQRAFEVGGKGYVLKAQAGSDLLPAVEAVLQGHRFVSRGLEADRCANPIQPTNHPRTQSRSHSLHKKARDPVPPNTVTG